MKTLNSCVGAVVLFIATMVVAALLRGLVLTILWGWFVVPTFHLPALAIVPAIGLSIVVGYLTYQSIDVKSPERTTTETWVRTGLLSLAPLVSLAVGWVVHMFMGGTS